MRKLMYLAAAMLAAMLTVGVSAPAASPGPAEAGRKVTFVNHSGERIWLGSRVNDDGSGNLSGLPAIEDGQSADITVPSAEHWRGKFFARQGCKDEGGKFHCEVGDCGPKADQCTTGEQPSSLAEVNFDGKDKLAPWYNVSYVNAVSLPITIEPIDGKGQPGSTQCEEVGCSEKLLQHCPPENLTKDGSGKPVLCTNPNRDAKTAYSDAMTKHCPKAYAWSKQDTEGGNQVMRDCPDCGGFTVTFHRGT